MARFSGSRVVVTGASRGLGRAIAEAFGREGARVWVGYLTHEDDARVTVANVEREGGTAEALAFDVRDPRQVDAAFDEIAGRAGRLDVLVNNAGVSRDNLFPLLDDEAWRDVIATNLMGAVHCTRAAVRAMWPQQSGAIVNVASASGLFASPGQANYAASKGGLIALTKTLAAELAGKGIRVNAVVPGLLTVGMAARLDRKRLIDREGRIPIGRLGTPDEIARAVLYLASSDASYVVGHALVVDGGMTL